MKRYSTKEMKNMSGIQFAADILQEEFNHRTNVYSPTAEKLQAAIDELKLIESAKISYQQLRAMFIGYNGIYQKKPLYAYIVFTEDSWKDKYLLTSRTYLVSSENKAFMPGMGGYSIYGSSLDGSDKGVRLERYMEAEGVENGWEVDYCILCGDPDKVVL